MSGESKDAISTQTVAIIKSFETEERDKIVKKLDTVVNVPPDHVASMKASLNIPWYQMREIKRWLKTFNVNLASEKKTRLTIKEWIGEGLKAEMAPLTKIVTGSKRVEVILTPWVYLYNLVAHVLRQLKELKDHGLLVHHSFISNDEIIIKIGGDHGDKSFKMSYQIANVRNPNRRENTVVFSIFEAKDSVANLRTCLERFRNQASMLQRLKFDDKNLKLFMFGDYEFLCTMYGLTGANGKFPP